MKILKAIGGVFVKIWRWIKNTAWVQPLLIVGTIFGVIFSIPAITRGVQNLIESNNSADNFYGDFKLTLEGGANSAAANFLNRFITLSETKKEERRYNPGEERYFLYFINSGNAQAKEAKDAFITLRDNWNGTYRPSKGGEFKLYTIYTDETTSETTSQVSAFSKLLVDYCPQFFEYVGQYGQRTNYYINKKITDADLQAIEACDVTQFKVPTLMYVDWTHQDNGLAEVFFSINGTNKFSKATFLKECWNYENDFEA